MPRPTRDSSSSDVHTSECLDDKSCSVRLRRRLRVGRACDRCRIKKNKCDEVRPCSRCKSVNVICTFDAPRKFPKKAYPSGYVELLERREKQLSRAIERLYKQWKSAEGKSAMCQDGVGTMPSIHDIIMALKPFHDPDDDGTSPFKDKGDGREGTPPTEGKTSPLEACSDDAKLVEYRRRATEHHILQYNQYQNQRGPCSEDPTEKVAVVAPIAPYQNDDFLRMFEQDSLLGPVAWADLYRPDGTADSLFDLPQPTLQPYANTDSIDGILDISGWIKSPVLIHDNGAFWSAGRASRAHMDDVLTSK